MIILSLYYFKEDLLWLLENVRIHLWAVQNMFIRFNSLNNFQVMRCRLVSSASSELLSEQAVCGGGKVVHAAARFTSSRSPGEGQWGSF